MEPGREKGRRKQAGAGEVHKEEKKCKKNKKGTVTFTVEEAEKMEQLAKELEDDEGSVPAFWQQNMIITASVPQRKKNRFILMPKWPPVKEFLGVYDNLERAVAQEGDDDSPHKKAWR